MNKYRDFIAIFLSYVVQSILYNLGIIDKNNLLIDLFSYLLIFVVIYVIIGYFMNKSKKLGIIISTFIIILILYIITIPQQKLIKYNNTLKNAQEINVSDMLHMLDENDNSKEYIFLLTSDKCKYCIGFVPTIKENIKQSDYPVYYIKKEADINNEIKNYFSVEKIPFLVRIKGNSIEQNYFEYPINYFVKE